MASVSNAVALSLRGQVAVGQLQRSAREGRSAAQVAQPGGLQEEEGPHLSWAELRRDAALAVCVRASVCLLKNDSKSV